jgi:hypothetical protein
MSRGVWPGAAPDALPGSAKTRCVARLALLLILVALVVGETACGNVLDFQDAIYVSCILNSDCPGSLNRFTLKRDHRKRATWPAILLG